VSDIGRNMVSDSMYEVARMAIRYGVAAKDMRQIMLECWEEALRQKWKEDLRTFTEATP
jgi:hypothetical protein